MPVTHELDVSTIPPPSRHPEIFGVFDGLKPDEAFVLINDHDPKEERMLYPMTDQAAGNDRARDDLVKRLQSL